MRPRFLSRQGWSLWHLAWAILLGGAGLALTWDAWSDMFVIAWNDQEQSHVFLAPIVAVWMFSVRRARLRTCPPTGQGIGPVILVVGWVLSSIGYNNAVQSFWHGGAVLVVLGCLLTAVGKNVLFRFFPAFAVLVFLVPIPGIIRESISQPLQSATAAATQAIMETLGIPVERLGNLLSINGHEVAVAEACNGMRMVFALVLVSFAFAFGMPLRNWVRALVLAASPVAALACNVLRLIPTVLLYGYRSQEVAEGFHDISGWLMLPLAFGLLMGVLHAVRWALIPVNRYNLAYQ